ncbi:MAG TPA: nucleotidyltransferase family protein [Gemmatimonadales bacterium]|nr:nucleotidyltransferase family protein [Gemmatimonadales bacterium]
MLAAGRGERFGGDKLLAPLGGRPLLAHTLGAVRSALRAGAPARGCVVVAADRPALAALARDAGLEPVTNPDPASGLGDSLACAARWLDDVHARGGPAAAVIFLGDQPRVRPDVVKALVSAWRAGSPYVRPRYAEEPDAPGHPALVDRAVWPIAARLAGDQGLGPALGARGVHPAIVEVPGRNPDVDTPADLVQLEGSSS